MATSTTTELNRPTNRETKHLDEEAVRWVAVTERADLLGRLALEAVVPAAKVALAVLPLAVQRQAHSNGGC